MDGILHAYGSSSEDNDEGEDDGAFVGPSRPPPREPPGAGARDADNHGDDIGDVEGPSRPPMRDDAHSDDDDDNDTRIAWLRSLCEEPLRESQEKDASCSAPELYSSRVSLPPAVAESANTNASQDKVIEILLEARRRNVTPGDILFASSTFTNPDFLQRCAVEGIGTTRARGSNVRVPFTGGNALDSSDYYKGLASEQRAATEKYLASRNGISFTTSQQEPEQRISTTTSTVDSGQKAAAAAAIAKARVEARIALQKAGKLR